METSPETISSFLKGLNLSKVASIDNLPVKFLNDGTDILARPTSQLCNLSICCLEVVKLQIKSFFKKCSQIDPDNYHHVSLHTILSKIMERIVLHQIQGF